MGHCCAFLCKPIPLRLAIELHLAHTVRIKVEVAHNRTDLFKRRRSLMEQWVAYLDGAAGGTVVPLDQRGGRTYA